VQLTHRPFKLLVTGASGTGKTTYWTRYLLGTQARVKLVFDHEGEFAYRQKVPAATTPEALADGCARGWGIFDPSAMFPGDLPRAFDFFCEFAFEVATRLPGRKVFACDELQKLVGTQQVSRELALVLETGRRYGLDAALISQQPNLIHNRIRNQLTEVCTFRQIDHACLDWLESAGFDTEAVRLLEPGQFSCRSMVDGGVSGGTVF
jgi:hypothetical protein